MTAQPARTTERRLIILGATGSIGTQALEVVERLHAGSRDALPQCPPPRLVGLAGGGRHLSLLAQQAVRWEVGAVAVATDGPEVQENFGAAWTAARDAAGLPAAPAPLLFTGAQAACDLLDWAQLGDEDVVLNGITGSVGLKPTLRALASGATVALANKESLVAGGSLVQRAMTRAGQIVPVDSEHSAIAQALLSGHHGRGLTVPQLTGTSELSRIILTASGGPFRGRSRADMEGVTPEQALAHPTWSMGPVVTINSSTLMNKGLELIEASLLFDVPPTDIEVVVHPQSFIHSMVQWRDGATVAQTSPPDMKLPIALGLTWPQRPDLSGLVDPGTWATPTQWSFEPVDEQTFGAVALARHALSTSATHPAVMNAANEEAVAAFLDGQLPWLGITQLVATVLQEHEGLTEPSYEDVVACETWARQRAHELLSTARH